MKINKIEQYLFQTFNEKIGIKKVIPIIKGYSNLTFKIELENDKNWVLRKPPLGKKIKSAHDMNREFTIQKKLWDSNFTTIPKPILYCNDFSILGDEFYIMEYVDGLTLRPNERSITRNEIKKLSETTIKELASLHNIDIKKSGLDAFHRGKGYLIRQIKGWHKRYNNALTTDAQSIDTIKNWLLESLPKEEVFGFVHNDFKFDNFIVDKENIYTIKAIVDWEMATVGDVFSDLGTTLSYWAESYDNGFLNEFTISSHQGNYTREEVICLYEKYADIKSDNWLFYYVLGCLKLAGITQQIYHRYKLGHTTDNRFKKMILIGNNCIENANRAIKLNRISNLYG
ncbi:MAG: phosphotransferase family protein [Tenacibaculum sp.]